MKQRHDGLRKLCGCPSRRWSNCSHPWHFNFQWVGEVYRFSLERTVGRIHKDGHQRWKRDRRSLGDPITSKSEAERERDRLRTLIREGKLQAPVVVEQPQHATLTLAQLLATYRKDHISVNRPRTAEDSDYVIKVIVRTELTRADGTHRAFGEWLVSEITTSVIESYQKARAATPIGRNRELGLLRHMFNWATMKARRYATDNPFLDGVKPTVKVKLDEHRRTRRLQAGEAERLLAACNPRLRALVEAAIETGCRSGELLSLQWKHVRFEPKAEITLTAENTKTKSERKVPISKRLRAILEMRRNGPDGKPHPETAYVFGNDAGERVDGIKRAWQGTVLRAHGHKLEYVIKVRNGKTLRTGQLTPECQRIYKEIDLRFHDLRREAGSRWLEGGIALHKIKQWLGHTNIRQTDTYLQADASDNDEVMRRYEEAQERLHLIASAQEKGGTLRANVATIADASPQESLGKLH